MLGFILKRAGRGPIALRMSPHALTALGAIALVLIHAFTTGSKMAHADVNGIWIATAALALLVVQATGGVNLILPGGYRGGLRRAHSYVFWAILILATVHVYLNAVARMM